MTNRRYNRIFSIAALTLFVIMGLMVRNSSEGILFDVAILEYLHSSSNKVILTLMKFISFISSSSFLLPVLSMVIIYMLFKKKYYISKLIMASSLGSWVLNALLKLLFNRTRPLEFFLVEQGGLSYPSGHSMVSMSLYLTFAYLICKDELFKNNKKSIYIAALLDVLLIGISRVYLGVHWPTDIIGGFIMGYIYFQIIVATIK